jgi:hypothetical protein
MDDYFEWASSTIWKSDHTRKTNSAIRRRHLDRTPLMDMPLEDIRPQHLYEVLKLSWGKKRGNGHRIRSVLHSCIEREIDFERYPRQNPASWKETSPLSKLLGPEPRSTPCAAALYTDIPKIVSCLTQVRGRGLEGYLTITEAARAYERDVASIADAVDRGELPGTIMREHYAWRRQVRYVPIASLKAKFGEFKYAPVPAPHEGVVLSSDLLLAIILSATRPGMMPSLCWGQFKDKKGYHYLEYRPAEDGKPSQHKNGWDLPFPYLVMVTPGLRNIFENRRQQLIRDGVEITSDTRVFQHGRTNSGVDSLFRHPVSNNTAGNYLRESVIPKIDVEKKTMTPQGMRATFGTWAKEEYTENDELVELTLGHVIGAIRDNPTNWSYLYGIERPSSGCAAATK